MSKVKKIIIKLKNQTENDKQIKKNGILYISREVEKILGILRAEKCENLNGGERLRKRFGEGGLVLCDRCFWKYKRKWVNYGEREG